MPDDRIIPRCVNCGLALPVNIAGTCTRCGLPTHQRQAIPDSKLPSPRTDRPGRLYQRVGVISHGGRLADHLIAVGEIGGASVSDRTADYRQQNPGAGDSVYCEIAIAKE